MKRFLFFTTILTLNSFVLAQESAFETLPGLNLTAWGASVIVFGGAMMLITEFIKTEIKKRRPNVPKVTFTIVSFGISLLVSYTISTTQNLTDPTFLGFPSPLDWIAYGVIAGAIASGWYDLDKKRRPKDGANSTTN